MNKYWFGVSRKTIYKFSKNIFKTHNRYSFATGNLRAQI